MITMKIVLNDDNHEEDYVNHPADGFVMRCFYSTFISLIKKIKVNKIFH